MSKRIGYTTGVFDMFHIGHLHLLKKAKNHCNYLIVGVSSDELVEEYKGKKPIIPFEHRLEIISALSVVDEVVVQSHRDKVKQYHDIGFDVMFVGDDWRGSPLFESVENEFQKFGVSLEFFEYTKEVSSTKFTKILQEIQDLESKIR
jgi:glycerol-3-phosphate cytidylyltransferase